jgi:hypothetical protein
MHILVTGGAGAPAAVDDSVHVVTADIADATALEGALQTDAHGPG